MTITLSDEEVIRQYSSTDPLHCFEILYNRYAGKVYQRCLSFTKDSYQAQDFTHDIFLKIFARLEHFQARSSFATWLYSISYNYCVDQIRLAKRMLIQTVEDNYEYITVEQNDEVAAEETLQLVKKLVERLPLSEQTLLHLKYEQALSHEQIARQYGLKESAVKMRIKRVRDKVYSRYQELVDH